MQPAYQGRNLVFTRNGNIIESNGVFFHPEYVKTPLGKRDTGPRPKKMIGMMFFAFKTVIFHSAIVKYRNKPSVQSQVFSCALRR